jgi:DNA polymerase-3 subunit delta
MPQGVPAITVIVGEEELLVERAVSSVLAGTGTGLDVHDVRAAELAAGQLSLLTAPSLFGGDSVVIIRGCQDAPGGVATEISDLAAARPAGVILVLTHAGGARGKALLATLAQAGAKRIECRPVKRFGERLDFLRAEFSRADRKADESGLRTLIDAVGTDLRDLAAAADQLCADTTGVITAQVVARYYRGRAEATGFSVADKVLEGNLADALAQLRWALATGTSPVLITSALAQGIRSLVKVGAAGRGKSADALATELGMPSWKIDKARQQLRGWSAAGLADAHAAVAQADADVKGEAASPDYALERALRMIARGREAR